MWRNSKSADNNSMSYEEPTHEELAKDTLGRMMANLSEDCWCAVWLRDLEFTLWETLTAGGRDFGWGRIEERDITRMKNLHERAGGWWIWVKGEDCQRFVTTEEWLQILAKKEPQAGCPGV